ncbi:MAG TPA: hypothetical protein PKC65_04710 [Pyrinomonadaceae bacterium]|nr:hypothetical protein [Pyrinomonadaceae bacterium]
MTVHSVFKDWQDWASTDWREFAIFFSKKWGVEAFSKAEAEFASQMSLSGQFFGQLTDIGVGKLMEAGVGGVLATAFSIGDILSKLAGIGYVASWNMLQGRTRENPIKLIGTSVFSDEYTFDESKLKDYVQFILYWYPRDLQSGFFGFRYGGPGSLRSTKQLPLHLRQRRRR